MKKTYKISVTLLSAMHINAGIAPDSKRIYVKSDGKPYIPATLFKGIVRGNFNMLINTFAPEKKELTDYFFGSEGYIHSHSIFDNLYTQQHTLSEMRSAVSISRYTRKATEGALVFSEAVSCNDSSGQPVVFCGELTVYYRDDMLKYPPTKSTDLAHTKKGRRCRVEFITPAMIKTGGRPSCRPDIVKYFYSAVMKYNIFENGNIDFQLFSDAFDSCRMTSYSLESASYNVSGHIFPGMTGYFDIDLPSDAVQAELLRTILAYSEYCGVGGKTGMGMGGVTASFG